MRLATKSMPIATDASLKENAINFTENTGTTD